MKYTTHVWKPFDRFVYRGEFRTKFIWGVLRQFGRDMRRCHERIWKGYCDFDLYSITDWFLGIMPAMVEDFRDNLHGYPDALDSVSQKLILDDSEKEDDGMKAWQAVLSRMAFLLREADERTCSRKNPYEDEYMKAHREFSEKYGSFGEKLLTEEEKKQSQDGLGIRWYILSDVEEYKPISDQYFAEERKIDEYRHECKEEALGLFTKWFDHLWD